MGDVLSRPCLAVAKVPLVRGDALARRGACELGGVATAYRGVGEVRSGLRVNGHSLGDGVGAGATRSAYGERHLVGTRVGVGVCHVLSRPCLTVAEVPLVRGDALARRGACELGGSALADCGVSEVGRWLRIDSHSLRLCAGAMSTAVHGKSHLVGACVGIGVRDILPRTCLSVTEVPLVALYLLSRWVGGGGAGKLGGVAHTYRGEVEVGRRHGVDDHIGGGTVGLVANSDGTGIGASHRHRAVRTGGVLLVRVEPARASPAVARTRLSVGGQHDGFTHAIRAAVVDQRGQNAAVSGASTGHLAEIDVAGGVGEVGDNEDEIVSRLSGSRDQAVLIRIGGITATDHFVGRQAIGARRCRVGERTPAAEVDILRRSTIHVDIDVSRVQYPHIIPCGVGGRIKATVIRP